jgi:putative ubiquitin-RnfH superfamily antitoxin RatB of RatAB toxin-antitoxin module
MARLRVEVVYALAEGQAVVSLQLPESSSAGAAVAASGLAGRHGLEEGDWILGIGGRRVAPGRLLRDGDRVEMLRPLAMDPKEARRKRARKLRRRQPSS